MVTDPKGHAHASRCSPKIGWCHVRQTLAYVPSFTHHLLYSCDDLKQISNCKTSLSCIYFLPCFPFTEVIKKAQRWLLMSRKSWKVIVFFLVLRRDQFFRASFVPSFILSQLYAESGDNCCVTNTRQKSHSSHRSLLFFWPNGVAEEEWSVLQTMAQETEVSVASCVTFTKPFSLALSQFPHL